MPEALTRQIGPLAAWQWALVLAGGYIGYRFLKTGSLSSGGSGSNGTATDLSQTGSNIIQGPQGEPGPPGPIGPPGLPGTKPPTGTVPPTKNFWGANIPAWLKIRDPSGSKTAAVFAHYKLGYGTVIDWTDMVALFKKVGINRTVYGPADLTLLFQKAGLPVPVYPPPPTTVPPVNPNFNPILLKQGTPVTVSAIVPLSQTAPLNPVGIGFSPPSTTVGNQVPNRTPAVT